MPVSLAVFVSAPPRVPRGFSRATLPCATDARCRCGDIGSGGVPFFFMRVTMLIDAGHDLDATLFHAAQGKQAIGDALQPVGSAAHDDDLQAQIVVDVHVQCGAHLLAQFVLKVGQPFAKVAHMMVVNHGQGRNGVHSLGHLGPAHLRASEIAKQFRARAPSLAHNGVEIAQERAFEGNTESNQRVFHRGKTTAPPWIWERAC
jgi:hypothetical protein